MFNQAASLFTAAVTKYRSIALYIPGSPDPDAVASAHAIRLLLASYAIDADIFTEKNLSLPQNQAFVERLKIPLSSGSSLKVELYDAYIVPDFQDNRVESIGDKLPCAAHIDHHPRAEKAVKADFTLIRTDAGSTSTLVALLMKELDRGFLEPDLVSLATALTFGIQTDTDKYRHKTPLDHQALEYLAPHLDEQILEDLNNMPYAPETMLYFNRAMGKEVVYKDWGFYGIGYVDSANRDSIAITADLVLQRRKHRAVVVFAIVENRGRKEMSLDVSLRSGSSTVDLNRLIKRITPTGGGRKYKGAYQVNLDYFLNAPDRDRLWQVVEETTLKALRDNRDSLFITGIESLFDSIMGKMAALIRRDRAGSE